MWGLWFMRMECILGEGYHFGGLRHMMDKDWKLGRVEGIVPANK